MILTLKVKLRRLIKSILLKNGIFMSRAVTSKQLTGFFDQIRPVKTNFELIRVGDLGDGGYLVPDDLEGLDACFSPGVSLEASFELDLAKRGIPSYMADYSVDFPPIKHELFEFEKKYLGARNDDIFLTLESWMQSKNMTGDKFILQMDIEGSEYEVVLHASIEVLKKFRIIVIEFHNMGMIFNPAGLILLSSTFEKLLSEFDIVHIHPNNCAPLIGFLDFMVPPVMEFTFLRKDRITKREFNTNFPHPLDVKNVYKSKDISLPKCWNN